MHDCTKIHTNLLPTDVQALLTKAQEHAHSSPPFTVPRQERRPSTWPATYPEMDKIWDQAVKGEHIRIFHIYNVTSYKGKSDQVCRLH
jgi:hypothetical protein